MSNVSVLADYGDQCGECPLWDSGRQQLYWTDITGRRVFSWSFSERTSAVISEDFEVAGLALDAETGFVAANSKGFWLWDGAAQPRLIADAVDGQACALNDCIADPAGRLFAGSCFYNGSANYPSGHLFRLERDGSVQVVDDGLRLSNGLGFSPDESILYLADSAERRIYAYDYRRGDGSLRNKRIFVQVPREEGIPDGLTVDAAGFVWSVQWFGACLVRYDADGKVERRVSLPASQTSSMTFGGPDLTDIFVTSAGLPDALPLAPLGYDPTQVYSGGKLYHLNLGIPGKEEYRTRVLVDP